MNSRDVFHDAMSFLRMSLISTTFFLPSLAQAQRGGASSRHEPQPASASHGIPGFFDTSVADKGSVAFEFPSFAVDYGVTDRWTIGINGIAALSSTVAWSASLDLDSIDVYLKSRYRLFSTDKLLGAVTVYYANFNAKQTDSPTQSRFRTSAGTLNISKVWNRNHFGFSSALVSLDLQTKLERSLSNESAQVNLAVYTGWWRYALLDSLESETLVSVCPAPNLIGNQATLQFNASLASCFGSTKYAPMARALLNWRSSKKWFWTVGYVTTGHPPKNGFPYFGFNTVWTSEDKTDSESASDSETDSQAKVGQ